MAAWVGAWSGCALPGRGPALALLIGAALAAVGRRLSSRPEIWTPLLVALLYAAPAAARWTPWAPLTAGWHEIEGVVLDLRVLSEGREIVLAAADGTWRLEVPRTGIAWLDRFDPPAP
ncbi:MAG: hypothetical protein Q9Q13_02195 [Acidobacteriota bacterium]|nr:hypothetical protein [Acidobacteriota bacterium]